MKVIINSLMQHVWGLRGVLAAALAGSLAAMPWGGGDGVIATCLGGAVVSAQAQFMGHCAPCWAALGCCAALTATFLPHKRTVIAAA